MAEELVLMGWFVDAENFKRPIQVRVVCYILMSIGVEIIFGFVPAVSADVFDIEFVFEQLGELYSVEIYFTECKIVE